MNKNRKTLAQLQVEQEVETNEEVVAETETEDSTTTQTEDTESSEEAPETVEATPEASASTNDQMVSISAVELSQLRADASQWRQNSGRFEVLNTWYNNMKNAGVTHDSDASDNKPLTKRVSKGNAKAIAIAENMQ